MMMRAANGDRERYQEPGMDDCIDSKGDCRKGITVQ